MPINITRYSLSHKQQLDTPGKLQTSAAILSNDTSSGFAFVLPAWVWASQRFAVDWDK